MINTRHIKYIKNSDRNRLYEMQALIDHRQAELDDEEDNKNYTEQLKDEEDMDACASNITATEVDRRYEASCKAWGIIPTPCVSATHYSLADLNCSPCTPCTGLKTNIPEKRKTNMRAYATVNNATPLPTDQVQRDYLLGRIFDLECNKDSELRKLFFVDDDEAPNSPKATAERLAAGKYVISNADSDKEFGWHSDSKSVIKWRDPSKPADMAGYRAADEAFMKAKQATRDTIVITDPATGLTALQALEAWVPTGAAN